MVEDEKAAEAVRQWTNDLTKICGLASPCSLLKACLTDYPTGDVIGTSIWVGMASEFLFKHMEETPQGMESASSDLQQFLKSGHTVVRMNKKDLPADILQKIEKLQKEHAPLSEIFLS